MDQEGLATFLTPKHWGYCWNHWLLKNCNKLSEGSQELIWNLRRTIPWYKFVYIPSMLIIYIPYPHLWNTLPPPMASPLCLPAGCKLFGEALFQFVMKWDWPQSSAWFRCSNEASTACSRKLASTQLQNHLFLSAVLAGLMGGHTEGASSVRSCWSSARGLSLDTVTSLPYPSFHTGCLISRPRTFL